MIGLLIHSLRKNGSGKQGWLRSGLGIDFHEKHRKSGTATRFIAVISLSMVDKRPQITVSAMCFDEISNFFPRTTFLKRIDSSIDNFCSKEIYGVWERWKEIYEVWERWKEIYEVWERWKEIYRVWKRWKEIYEVWERWKELFLLRLRSTEKGKEVSWLEERISSIEIFPLHFFFLLLSLFLIPIPGLKFLSQSNCSPDSSALPDKVRSTINYRWLIEQDKRKCNEIFPQRRGDCALNRLWGVS